MKQYSIKNQGLCCTAEVCQGKLDNIFLKSADGKLFFDRMEMRLNHKKADLTVIEIKADNESIRMTLVINERHKVLYHLSLLKNGLLEHVVLHYQKGFKPESFDVVWSGTTAEARVLPVPIADYTKQPQILEGDGLVSANITAEGMLILQGEIGLAIAKQPSDEEPVLVRVCTSDDQLHFIPAGISQNHGFSDVKAVDEQWDAIDFHCTNYLLFSGDVEDGCYAYRNYMAECGSTMPEDYNPPVNYCIYYECAKMDQASVNLNQDEIKECHSMTRQVIDDMTAIAQDLHCNLLYLDQGWDTDFGSLIWDEERLGSAETLVSDLKARGMSLGVLVPLHAAADSYDKSVYLKNNNQQITNGDAWHKYGICVFSDTYQALRTERLKKLADSGIRFFSYDFHNYQECFDKNHGHSVPMTRYQHARTLAENQKTIKRLCKDVLIESHDWFNAGMYYYPVYMFSDGHHERWGFEYMWKPVEDYQCGRLQNLYYYNLCYEKPLYLHMNLEGIGDNAEVFWYFASTVRHFGMGNYSALSNDKKELAKKVSGVYAQLKDYYSQGEFYGKNPLLHIHHLPQRGTVVNLFSNGITDSNEIQLTKEDLGLETIKEVKVMWGNLAVAYTDDSVVITPQMQSNDAVVVVII